ncbi:MAG: [FeFe] hydrogenase, group A [Atopobiaceae bacterium]|jgi:NADP-reducing hydrogenase subunit HndD
MVKLTIDSIPVEVAEHTTILDAAASVGIKIPTLCFLRDLNEVAACRACVVEIKGLPQLVAACNNFVDEGMEVLTNSPKVREARKANVEFLLSRHDSKCTSCVRNGNCSLQSLTHDLGITNMPFDQKFMRWNWPASYPLQRNNNKCINCLRCIQVCSKVQATNIWDLVNRSSHTAVNVSHTRRIEDSDCTLCGQCITHCPVGALYARDDTQRVFDALADPERVTIVQVAPAVRAAWGEAFGVSADVATDKRLVTALKRMGFDYVFDTDFGADLTIMEEASELLDRMQNPDHGEMPMFTSCCPGWIRYLKGHYPELTGNLSTSKSPHQMFGAIAKSYLAEKLGTDPRKFFVVSIMPCVAKKAESELPNQNDACEEPDVDCVLTVRELDRMVSEEHLDIAHLPETEFDEPLGESTGAAVIFGATGGVMEAALRTAYHTVTGQAPKPDMFSGVRGMDGWKEATFDMAGTPVRVAVASGLQNTHRLIEALKAGEVHYDFIEIMACPGGCAGGGGQPIHDGEERAEVRGDVLWGLDARADLRNSYENPSIQRLYSEYLEAPLSERAEHLLHTDHFGWEMPLSPEVKMFDGK